MKISNNKISIDGIKITENQLINIINDKNLEKKELYKLLEKTEEAQGEYIYIDIVMPTRNYIDYAAIENAITELDDTVIVSDVYKLLTNL